MKYRLGDICSITKGNTGIMKAIPGQYPLVALSDERKLHNKYQFDANAVIIPLISSTGHGHASMKRVHYQEGKFALGNILCAVIPNNEEILLAKYLHIYLQHNKDSLLVPLMKGAANVSLPMSRLAEIQIEIPTFKQQQHIINLESLLDKQVSELDTQYTKQLMKMDQLRQAFLKEAMQGKLVPQDPKDEPASELLKRIKAEKAQLIKEKKLKPGKELPPIKPEEIPYPIPDTWTWCRLGELLHHTSDSLRRGPFGSSITKSMFVPKSESATKIYEQRNAIYKNHSLGNYYINLEEHKSLRSFLAYPGDIIISCAGTIGETYLLPDDAPIGVINQALLKLKLNHDAIHDEFFLQAFKAIIKSKVNEDAKGSAMKNLGSVNYLKNLLLIPLPPLEEQTRIVEKLNNLMHICDELKTSIEHSKDLNDRLLKATLREALTPKN